MGEILVRNDLRPGDIGALTALHGRVYAAEHRLDATFEAYVARATAEAVLRGFPTAGEAWWAVDHPSAGFAGGLALTDEGDGRGRVRWFLLDPVTRGIGLGARLLGDLLATARDHGYRRLELETFSELAAAAHLYRSAGFERVRAAPEDRWGRTLTVEQYELQLGR